MSVLFGGQMVDIKLVVAVFAAVSIIVPASARADEPINAVVHGAFDEPAGGCEASEPDSRNCQIEGSLSSFPGSNFAAYLKFNSETETECGATSRSFEGSGYYFTQHDLGQLELTLSAGSYEEESCSGGAPYTYTLNWTITGGTGAFACATGGTITETGSSTGEPFTQGYVEGIDYTGSASGTIIGCSPQPTTLAVGCGSTSTPSEYLCEAKVKDPEPDPLTPTGTVTFSNPTGGSFASSTTCELRHLEVEEPNEAACSVDFIPPAPGASVKASYGGDDQHTGSSATSSLLGGSESSAPSKSSTDSGSGSSTGATSGQTFCDASCQACGPTTAEAMCHIPSPEDKHVATLNVQSAKQLLPERHSQAFALMSNPLTAAAGANMEAEAVGIESAIASWEVIANDPYDPNWHTIYKPSHPLVIPLKAGHGFGKQAARAFNAYQYAQAQAQGLLSAVATSINRANSAVKSGNSSLGAKQAAAARSYAKQGARTFTNAIILASKARTALKISHLPTITQSDFVVFQRAIAKHGLPRTLKHILTVAGLASKEPLIVSEIEHIKQIEPNHPLSSLLIAPNLSATDKSAAQDLNSIATTLH